MIKSIQFPHMLSQRATQVVEEREVTQQNLASLLYTGVGQLFGDPGFGSKLQRYLFEQNSQLLADIITDEIQATIAMYMPQIRVERKDIKVWADGYHVYANIKARNMLDTTLSNYQLQLTQSNAR